MRMTIKESIDIHLDFSKLDYSNKKDREFIYKRWVAVDDILKRLNDESITSFEDLKDNIEQELLK